MIKKEVFEWISNKQKTIELRRGKAKKGDLAIFQCARAFELKYEAILPSDVEVLLFSLDEI